MNYSNNSSAEEEKGPLAVVGTNSNNADNLDAIAADIPQQRDLLSNDIKQSNLTTNNTSSFATDGIDDNTTDGSSSMMLTSTQKEDDVLNVDTVSLYNL